jgi:G:T-mismatch repair DNA endonuclease (very short patch repair protein)
MGVTSAPEIVPRQMRPFGAKKSPPISVGIKGCNRQLNRLGWRVLRIWEHSVVEKALLIEKRLLKAVAAKKGSGLRGKVQGHVN